MPNIKSSSDELFKLYQPRFRQIALVPRCFGNKFRDYQHVYFFSPRHLTAAEEIHSTLYRGGYYQGNFLQFDVKKAGFNFSFTYDSGNPLSIDKQFDVAGGAAILEGPFKDVEFYVDPDGFSTKVEGIKIALTHSGGEMPGLVIPERLMAGWRFFIPDESAEYKAIELALAVEANQRLLDETSSAAVRRSELTTRHGQILANLQSALQVAA